MTGDSSTRCQKSNHDPFCLYPDDLNWYYDSEGIYRWIGDEFTPDVVLADPNGMNMDGVPTIGSDGVGFTSLPMTTSEGEGDATVLVVTTLTLNTGDTTANSEGETVVNGSDPTDGGSTTQVTESGASATTPAVVLPDPSTLTFDTTTKIDVVGDGTLSGSGNASVNPGAQSSLSTAVASNSGGSLRDLVMSGPMLAASGDGMYSDGSIPYVTNGGEAARAGEGRVPGVIVQIGYTQIKWNGILLPAAVGTHTFDIITDTVTGAQYATRAGPTPGAKDYGRLFTTSGDWTTSFVDKPSETVNLQLVGISTMSIADAQARVGNYSTFIDGQNIKYVAQPKAGGTGANSNSYAFSFPQQLGFPRPTPILNAPGYDVRLPVPAPSTPIP